MKLPEIKVTPLGRTMLFALGGFLSGALINRIFAADMIPWVMVAVAYLGMFKLTSTAGKMIGAHARMYDALANIIENYMPAAEAYDRYTDEHVMPNTPMPNAATQIVQSIAGTIRDLGTMERDMFSRKFEHRLQQLPKFDTEVK